MMDGDLNSVVATNEGDYIDEKACLRAHTLADSNCNGQTVSNMATSNGYVSGCTGGVPSSFTSKLCVSCYQVSGVTKIRVQSNGACALELEGANARVQRSVKDGSMRCAGLPKFCPTSPNTVSSSTNIDFEVDFNPGAP